MSRLEDLHGKLIAAVESIRSGDDWRRMLDTARRFHAYSANNIWLILAQRPEATRAAGYTTWRQLGRHVRPGERGIAILAPCVSRPRRAGEKDPAGNDGEARVVRGFRVVHVFDEGQTEGAALETLAPAPIEGDAPAAFWDRLAGMLDAQGFALVRGDCSPANGATNHLTRTVIVRTDLVAAQAARTLAHEVAHALLHDGTEYLRGCRGLVEVEAESVSYLVCGHAGFATDAYSFPYVTHWAAGDVDVVRQSAERVIVCARRILAGTGASGERRDTRDRA